MPFRAMDSPRPDASLRPDAYLPDHWKAWLQRYRPARNGRLGASDFDASEVVQLQFEDGSAARFEYAFCVADEERAELAVFTEHCRHHVFGLSAVEYEGPKVPYLTGPA
jgi:hypothetical protein